MDEASRRKAASFSEQYLPKLVTVLREGYGPGALKADALAGLTVAIVALPLSMAIAIASGVGPERGLYTAIVGGFLVSLLGGSRFQIGGPAGAFIVLVAACVADIGVGGLLLATFLSGFVLMAAGALRLGSYIKFIPYPVTVGFTAGIAVIIFASQIKDLLGLTLGGPEPAEIVHKIEALWAARGTFSVAALALAAGTIALIETVKRWRPRWPSLLIGIVAASVLAAVMGLPVETIGSRFGALPRVLPVPSLPDLSGDALLAALPYAASFALLGAIESLLSAVVADGMSGRQHRSNGELVAQGVANIGSALFGGFCVTGTIARTATNVRSGSRGPVSGMLHALFLLAFMIVAAPLAAYIPLAALAGLLAIVAWNMAEKEEFAGLVRASRGDAAVVIVTFLLVVFRDLTEGIVVGFALGGLVFIHRMSEAARIEPHGPEAGTESHDPGVVVYRLHGAFFFGAAATLGSVLDRIAARPRAFVVDFTEVPFLDSSGAHSFETLAHKLHRRGAVLYLTGTSAEVRRALLAQGVREPLARYLPDIDAALEAAQATG
ncbi:STAS domain-containing protein [Frigidibacter albus]|uniref:STAS domain-containing protein n=1 Tax=Frigidibacter albus TaxID=1465486 RepID=A0A6L8VH10_9RHOB|nr:SulP family inorganic anion transporter [Frigidibacter albus]MZQ89414.1 STAS domain-containing protein [Frigidibacter albus]NBE31320.1 STAS domain-containing protein [Frigidibacter albus]GGH54040.1 sodium-independent anion transporter [Frigidibacter albus]